MLCVSLAMSCAGSRTHDAYVEHEPLEVVSIGGRSSVIYPAERGREAVFVGGNEVHGFWTPTLSELHDLEAGLEPALEVLRTEFGGSSSYWCRETTEIIDKLDNYRVQYLGVIVKGRKRILANYFFVRPGRAGDRFSYWTRKWVWVLDGGSNYWRIQFDLGSRKFVEFRANGYA